jgi:hypothetical protein
MVVSGSRGGWGLWDEGVLVGVDEETGPAVGTVGTVGGMAGMVAGASVGDFSGSLTGGGLSTISGRETTGGFPGVLGVGAGLAGSGSFRTVLVCKTGIGLGVCGKTEAGGAFTFGEADGAGPFFTKSTITSRCSGSTLLMWFFTSIPAFLQISTKSLESTFNSRASANSRTFSLCKVKSSTVIGGAVLPADRE